MLKHLTITEARGKLMELPEEFSQDRKLEVVEVTRRGEPILAILPWENYESYRETMDILADEKTMESIRRGLEDAQNKRSTPLFKVRKELGI